MSPPPPPQKYGINTLKWNTQDEEEDTNEELQPTTSFNAPFLLTETTIGSDKQYHDVA